MLGRLTSKGWRKQLRIWEALNSWVAFFTAAIILVDAQVVDEQDPLKLYGVIPAIYFTSRYSPCELRDPN